MKKNEHDHLNMHLTGDNVKRCEVCISKGQSSLLQLFQINLKEAIWLCPKLECPYPLNSGNASSSIIPRSAANIPPPKKKRSSNTSVSTSSNSSRSQSPVNFWQSASNATPIPPLISSKLKPLISLVSLRTSGIDKLHQTTSAEPTNTTTLPKFDHKALTQNANINKSCSSDVSTKSPVTSCNYDVKYVSAGLHTLVSPPKAIRVQQNAKFERASLPTVAVRQSKVGDIVTPLCQTSDSSVILYGSKEKKPLNNHCDKLLSILTEPKFTRASDNVSAVGQVQYAKEKKSEIDYNVPKTTSNLKTNRIDNFAKPKELTVVANLSAKNTKSPTSNLRCSDKLSSNLKPNTTTLTASSVGRKKQSALTVDRKETIYYIQWTNRDALCWLDVSLSLLVHSRLFHSTVYSAPQDMCLVSRDLLNRYAKAQSLLQKALDFKRYQLLGQKRTVLLDSGHSMIAVKTGGGESISNLETSPLIINANLSPITSSYDCLLQQHESRQAITTEQLQKLASELSNEARDVAEQTREMIWKFLYPKLKCEKGDNDSPVFALPLLLGEDVYLQQKFEHHFQWHIKCDICGYEQYDSMTKLITTFPSIPKDFSLRHPYFFRNCARCAATGQRMVMEFDKYPPIFMAHFVDGLHKEINRYDFFLNRQAYRVTGVIQYKNNPNHFVAWIRNPQLNLWMECNDLKHPLCHFSDKLPDFAPSQVHVVMWTCMSALSDTSMCESWQHTSKPAAKWKTNGAAKFKNSIQAKTTDVTSETVNYNRKMSSNGGSIAKNGDTNPKRKRAAKKTTQITKDVCSNDKLPLRSALKSPVKNQKQLRYRRTSINCTVSKQVLPNSDRPIKSEPVIGPNNDQPINSEPVIGKIMLKHASNLAALPAQDLATRIVKGGLLSSNKPAEHTPRKTSIFSGYISKNVIKPINADRMIGKSNKVVNKLAKSVCFKEKMPVENVRKAKKRHSDTVLEKQLSKYVRFNNVNEAVVNSQVCGSVVTTPQVENDAVNVSRGQITDGKVFQPDFGDVLGELCGKLDISPTKHMQNNTSDLSFEDLFNFDSVDSVSHVHDTNNVSNVPFSSDDIDFDMFF